MRVLFLFCLEAFADGFEELPSFAAAVGKLSDVIADLARQAKADTLPDDRAQAGV